MLNGEIGSISRHVIIKSRLYQMTESKPNQAIHRGHHGTMNSPVADQRRQQRLPMRVYAIAPSDAGRPLMSIRNHAIQS